MKCSHCGDDCGKSPIISGDNMFCCQGCETVFSLLNDNNLCNYYAKAEQPGIKINLDNIESQFEILDDDNFAKQFQLFKTKDALKVRFFLPQIHCSSCIWLLENLRKLDARIIGSEVNFHKKEITVTVNSKMTSKEIAVLLTSIGYKPNLNSEKNQKSQTDKELLIKIGIAGFCFGNIMLFSFPEYLGLEDNSFKNFFAWLSWGLSIPLVFYAGIDYIISAFKGIKQKFVNMDIPIALGIIVIFLRSTYEIIFEIGPGFFDSLAGLIFFLLIGKWFQNKTYQSLSFERTYKSYFPLSIQVKVEDSLTTTKLEDLKIGQTILVRNQEIIPADGILISPTASVDYSFVTGESDLNDISEKETIFAGGKNEGQQIEVLLTQLPSTSYLTQLWNNDIDVKKKSIKTIADQVSKYFTLAVLAITLGTAIFWFFQDTDKIWNTVTAVLIVACPCALALTIPFTLGNSIRYLGRERIYLKNTNIIEKLAKVKSIIFDKTGTLTKIETKNASYHKVLYDISHIGPIIKAMSRNSGHPKSVSIHQLIDHTEDIEISDYTEISGQGISCIFNDQRYFLGKPTTKDVDKLPLGSTCIYENEILVGYFTFEATFREGMIESNNALNKLHYDLHLLSGDSERDDQLITTHLQFTTKNYHMSPKDKLEFIQKINQKSMMIGDGLNDAGALMSSDVGIAVSDDVNYFVPSCDIIMEGDRLKKLNELLQFAKKNMKVIRTGFILSFIYNIIGLSLAISGSLSPIIAAILMPLSSISVVAFTSFSSLYYYKQLFQKK